MGLRYCSDTRAADWLVRSGTPAFQLMGFGPATFEAYARLRYIPDPSRSGQEEVDAEVPENHPSVIAQARRALHRLAPFTSTPQECYFCLWEGYGSLPPEVLRGPLVEIPHRRYALLRGSLQDIDGCATDIGNGQSMPLPSSGPPTTVGAWQAMSIRTGRESAPAGRPSARS